MKKLIVTILLIGMLLISGTACSNSQNSTPDPSGISKSEFDKLITGMTDSKVKSIVGSLGELISEQKNDTDKYFETVNLYKVTGETPGYAELELPYHKDKELFSEATYTLTGKTQYDLS